MGQLDSIHQAMRGIGTPMDLIESTQEERVFQEEVKEFIEHELSRSKKAYDKAMAEAVGSAVGQALSRHLDRSYQFEDRRATNQERQLAGKPVNKPSAYERDRRREREHLAKSIKVQKESERIAARNEKEQTPEQKAMRSLLAPPRSLKAVHPPSWEDEDDHGVRRSLDRPPHEKLGVYSEAEKKKAEAAVVARALAAQRRKDRTLEKIGGGSQAIPSVTLSGDPYTFEDVRATNQQRQLAEEKARREKAARDRQRDISGPNRGGPGQGGDYGGDGDDFDPSGRFHQGGLIDDGNPAVSSQAHPVIAQEGEFVLSKPAVAALGVGNVARLNRISSAQPGRAAGLREALAEIAGGPSKDDAALRNMLADERYHSGLPGERGDYYFKVRREYKLAYPGDAQGRPILAEGGLIDDGDPRVCRDDYPVRAPEGAFVLSRGAVNLLGADLLGRINAAGLSNDRVLLKAVKKALAAGGSQALS